MCGFSQKRVAVHLGLKRTNNISRWERGDCLPETESLLRLSVLYRTTPDRLYSDFCLRFQEQLAKKLLAQEELIDGQ
jgi:transcriptional regulator with XRE-family HTH domain